MHAVSPQHDTAQHSGKRHCLLLACQSFACCQHANNCRACAPAATHLLHKHAQVNYFNAKPEHVRDNRYLAARIELEDLLDTEPEVVKQRREKLRDVLIKVCRRCMHALLVCVCVVLSLNKSSQAYSCCTRSNAGSACYLWQSC